MQVMPPEGRFVIQRPRALHRVGFAAGSGITPILSIIASSLQEQPDTKFTLVYGNRRMDSVMFNEALQDLKDQYPDRLTLIHILSRQAQEVDLLEGVITRKTAQDDPAGGLILPVERVTSVEKTVIARVNRSPLAWPAIYIACIFLAITAWTLVQWHGEPVKAD